MFIHVLYVVKVSIVIVYFLTPNILVPTQTNGNIMLIITKVYQNIIEQHLLYPIKNQSINKHFIKYSKIKEWWQRIGTEI